MSVDTHCAALAQFFLCDVQRENDEPIVAELAQRIQEAIEDFLEEQQLEL